MKKIFTLIGLTLALTTCVNVVPVFAKTVNNYPIQNSSQEQLNQIHGELIRYHKDLNATLEYFLKEREKLISNFETLSAEKVRVQIHNIEIQESVVSTLGAILSTTYSNLHALYVMLQIERYHGLTHEYNTMAIVMIEDESQSIANDLKSSIAYCDEITNLGPPDLVTIHLRKTKHCLQNLDSFLIQIRNELQSTLSSI